MDKVYLFIFISSLLMLLPGSNAAARNFGGKLWQPVTNPLCSDNDLAATAQVHIYNSDPPRVGASTVKNCRFSVFERLDRPPDKT